MRGVFEAFGGLPVLIVPTEHSLHGFEAAFTVGYAHRHLVFALTDGLEVGVAQAGSSGRILPGHHVFGDISVLLHMGVDFAFWILFLPETVSDVFAAPVLMVAVETLVGMWRRKGAALFAPGACLDVVRCGVFAKAFRQCGTSGIPSGMYAWHGLLQFTEYEEHAFRVVVAAHERHTGDFVGILRCQGLQARQSEQLARIAPKVGTVTAWTGVGTLRKVDGEGHFIGEFLENYIVIDVF